MALTNDQITAQNFKDFYGQIRPYLNGQVPTFANQFSRSDLYSTSEKIIGSYTDGKPIYQKTISVTIPTCTTISVPVWGTTNIGASVKECLYKEGTLLVGQSSIPLPFFMQQDDTKMSCIDFRVLTNSHASTPNVIQIYNSNPGWSGTANITIRYTKVNDSAIKVGTGTDYSTDEQIIGSWIDGKPLYQKTLSFTTASTVGANKYGDFYGCTIVNISGGVIDGFDCFIPVNWYYDANNYFSVFGNPSNTHEGITVKTIRQSECDRPARITVRYTKTTD